MTSLYKIAKNLTRKALPFLMAEAGIQRLLKTSWRTVHNLALLSAFHRYGRIIPG